MKAPCKDCEDREIGCHEKCDRYQAYRQEIEERKPKSFAEYDYGKYVGGVKARIALRRMPNTRRNWKKEK